MNWSRKWRESSVYHTLIFLVTASIQLLSLIVYGYNSLVLSRCVETVLYLTPCRGDPDVQAGGAVTRLVCVWFERGVTHTLQSSLHPTVHTKHRSGPHATATARVTLDTHTHNLPSNNNNFLSIKALCISAVTKSVWAGKILIIIKLFDLPWVKLAFIIIGIKFILKNNNNNNLIISILCISTMCSINKIK